MLAKLKKNILLTIIFSAVVFLGLTLYADYKSVIRAIENFNPLLFLLVLALTSLNFFFRFLKWHYYAKLLKIKISFRDSLLIFLSGLVMSVTPGKFGEVLKSYLLKRVSGTEISVSMPIVVAERITDFFSVLILASIGALVFGRGIVPVLIVFLGFILITLFINNRTLSLRTIDLFGKIKFLRKHTPKIYNSYESSYQMLKIKPLYEMTLLSLFAWLPECLGFYVVLSNFDISVSVFWSIFVYTFSIIVGALTMMPAGIGLTEGSLTYFVNQITNQTGVAVSVTMIIRIATLWYAVIVGIIALGMFKKKFNYEI